MVFNDSYINAETVKELFIKLRPHFPDSPISLILDNARDQKCHLIWQTAQELNLDLFYLPPYSPNLNLNKLIRLIKTT